MTRKKVKLAYIGNDSARKATFKKRKKGLMKKVKELSTLCGIQACAIIFSPYDSQPEVWPSPFGVQQVLSQFKKMPEMEQSKKMVNQESFLRQRIAKANEQLKKHRKDNREKEITQVMFQSLTGNSLNRLSIMDLNDLAWLIDQNLKEINKNIETLNKNKNNNNNSSSREANGEVVVVEVPPQTVVQGQGVEVNNMERQQWLMELIGGGGGDEVMVPFSDQNETGLWSSAFFP